MHKKMISGKVHSIESFGASDGPGVRFIVFLAGCYYRCAYCHNPDTWDMNNSTEIAPDELLKKAVNYRPYWKDTGGITVSGGEPLLQIDFLIEFFSLCKKANINTCIETAGGTFDANGVYMEKLDKLLSLTDLVIFDVKSADDKKFKKITGKERIDSLLFGKYVSEKNIPMWIRYVLVPKYTDSDTELFMLRDYIKSLRSVKKVEILPYHTFGVFKYKELGIKYPLEGFVPPSRDLLMKAEEIVYEN